MVNVWKSFHEEVCKPSILLTTPVGILMVMTVESFDYFFLCYFEDLMCKMFRLCDSIKILPLWLIALFDGYTYCTNLNERNAD